MTAERWDLVKSLFELALTVGPDERAEFLEKHCGADDELRHEVTSLLESHDDDAGFLEQPVMSVKAMVDVPPTPSPEMIGLRIGAYELVREIGRGGMGAVYLAVRADNEFKKRVAIKLIRGGMESDFLVRRFRRERQILARLEHPNIARLIDGGTTGDGLPYFVMEYVEGEPLNHYCESRSLPVSERLEILVKACSAVHYAHRRMIVHRDLKPGNILVKGDGTPKLLDFGIAKLLDPDTADSQSETTMGTFRIVTPAYASPEQMRGEPATIRSDVYALGIILFELIAGHRPSTVPGQDPLALPDEMSDSDRDLAKPACGVVHKAIQPDPNGRYESAEEFAADLRRCLSGSPIPNYATAPTTTIDPVVQPSPGSVAVLPFRLLGTDSTSDGYLGLGITDALITKLSNVGRISVRSTSSVTKYAGLTDAVAAGRELGVEFVLEGRIQKLANRLRLTVQLVHVQNDVPVWAASFDQQSEDLLLVEDSISEQVAQALVPQLTGEEREQLARPGTASAKAHQAYLRGRWHWNKGTEDSLAQALLAFMQAIAEDPEYARAHAGVADYYVQLGIRGGLPPSESFAAAKQSAQTALRIDSSLAEAHASLGFATWAYDRDYATAAHHFQLAIALNPDYAPAHHWLGLLNSARGRHEMAIACLTRARKLDPSRAIYPADLAFCYSNSRRFERAIEVCEKAMQSLGEAPELSLTLALNYRFAGDFDKAHATASRCRAIAGDNLFAAGVLACIDAVMGNHANAKAALQDLERRAEDTYVSGCLMAQLHLALGDHDQALAQLERSWSDRDWWVLWLGVAPVWDDLRSLPRFIRLLDPQPGDPIPTIPPQPVAAAPARKRKRLWWAAAAVFILLVGAALLAYRLWTPSPVPFQHTAIFKLTTNGIALRSAISPDGQFVAYTADKEGRPVVWVRELNGSAAYRAAGPFTGEIRSVEFVREGKFLTFLAFPANQPMSGVLYIVPIGGGTPEKLMADVPGPISVSWDGVWMAYFRQSPSEAMDHLVVRKVAGGDERIVASRRYPDRFSWNSAPVWSRDGHRLACAVEGSDPAGFRVALTVVDLDGSVHPVPSPRWQWVGRVTWLKNSGLFVIGQEHNSSFQQIWYVPLRGEAAERISNDLNDYNSLSVVDDGSAMVSVQVQTLTNVYVLRKDDPRRGEQITPGSGRYFDLAWVPGGQIAYASDASGSADLWIMNADGTHQRQLTKGEGRNYAPSVSPDGRRLAFHTNRDGNWNVWLMDIESRHTVQLTKGTRDSNWPQFSADGAFVLFHHTGLNNMFSLWKTPVDGGAAVQVTSSLTEHPAVSPRDGRIASWYSAEMANPKWEIAIFAAAGGEPLKTFAVPETVTPDTALRWTPQGDGITYVDNRNGIGNIWLQPVDGGPPRAITTFDWGQIFSFDWSRDGRLVYSRGMSTSDVVLIRDTAQKPGSGWLRP